MSHHSRQGELFHNILHLLEGGANVARRKGLDADSSLRVGLAMALTYAGFNREETEDAIERIMAKALRLDPESEANTHGA